MSDDRLDVEQLLAELDGASRRLDKASTDLARKTKELEAVVDEETGEVELGLGVRYEIALDEAMLAIVADYEEREKRPPAEDVRAARARQRVRRDQPELDAGYRRANTEISALKTWISAQRQIVSARQSVLNGLRALGA